MKFAVWLDIVDIIYYNQRELEKSIKITSWIFYKETQCKLSKWESVWKHICIELGQKKINFKGKRVYELKISLD
ncbi:hypothetical protein TNIN_130681 [Trichonephila inaurata madagascariensis]|uniref:Uncharacterized protein n=1 Tax=Trichonephila inaurata madagascariensis TaxID=2747483 RepID=A0A8X7BRV3_9ARAC|nr:hypothetical protein TNIN_130681 [Trichonephila inaurata madagascariensis]